MPQPIWESSQKPLHPKCVWVDSFGASNSGRRHFIFDYSISTDHISYAKSVFCSCNNSNLSTTRQLGSAAKINGTKLYESNRRNNSEIETTKHTAHEIQKSTPKSSEMSLRTETLETCSSDEMIKSISKSPAELKNVKPLDVESEHNFLANRVLQWLDLASGRNLPVLKRSVYIEKTLERFKKRSLTAKETARDGSPQRDPNTKQRIQREPIRQLSMVFDDSDAVRSESRDTNANSTGSSLNFGNIFPVTYRCSRKFLSLRRSITVPAKANDLIDPMDTLATVTTASKQEQRTKKKLSSKRHKIKRIDYVDDQYRAMIERQILEQSCNIQMAKRQLHIFMPMSDTEKSISNSVPSDLDTMRLSARSNISNGSGKTSGRYNKIRS